MRTVWNMDEAKNKRSAAKGWLPRSVKELQELPSHDTTSYELLDDAVSSFDQRLGVYNDRQSEVEFLFEDPYDMEADMDETDNFLKSARKVKA